MSLTFQTPCPALAPFVEYFWSVDVAAHDTVARPQKVLPNGTINLIFNLSGYTHRDYDPRNFNRWSNLKDCWISGMRSTVVCIAPTVCTHVVGIRFKPGGLAPFVGFPVAELMHLTIDLEHALPRGECRAIHDRLLAAIDEQTRFEILESWLLSRGGPMPRLDRRVSEGLRLLTATGGSISIGLVAEQAGVSQRQLVRLFQKQVGMRPKELARVLRFQRLIRRLGGDEDHPEWSGLALDAGYYDQAHLIDEFQSLATISPTQYLLRRTNVPDFLSPE